MVGRREVAVQLTLSLFGTGSLRPALESYLSTQCYEIAEATVIDYSERARWLYSVLGEWTPLEKITYPVLVKLVRQHGPDGRGLKYVTLKKRLTFLRAALEHAYNMGEGPPPPKLPKLPDDGDRGRVVHTREEFKAFRAQLPEGRFRSLADLAYWTGMHTYDLFTMTRSDFDMGYDWGVRQWGARPELQLEAPVTGAFMRRNHKNKRCLPHWFPLEEEARGAIATILAATRPGPDALLIGRVWNIGKTFQKACDRAQVPRITPIRLRASFASRLLADGYPHEYVRLALGHVGEVRDDGTAKPATTLAKHYANMSGDVARMVPYMPPQGEPKK